MADVGGQPGNQNATKGKPWTTALQRALAHEHGTVEKGLLALARVVAKRAAEGDKDALREVSERLEGKTAQVIAGDADSPLTLVISPQDAKL